MAEGWARVWLEQLLVRLSVSLWPEATSELRLAGGLAPGRELARSERLLVGRSVALLVRTQRRAYGCRQTQRT